MSNLITRGLGITSSVPIPGSSGTVLDTYPAPDSIGIPTGTELVVYFDREMDLSSINSGTLVLTLPEAEDVFGPDLQSVNEIADSRRVSVVSSLPLNKYLEGTYTFYKANEEGELLTEDILDTEGDGTLWRTVVIFTPSKPLSPNLVHTILVSGDESTDNDFSSGIKTRTVFDPEESITGTGELTFSGGYEGSTEKTYVLEIQTGGTVGTATYSWWNKATPLSSFEGITTTGTRKLEDGIEVFFGADGTFAAGDKWEILCLPAISIGDSYSWNFTTGSGSIVLPPSSYSQSGIEELSSTSTSNELSVLEVSPVPSKYGVPIIDLPYDGNVVYVTFNTTSELDEGTLTEAISLVSESATGDDRFFATGDLEFTAVLTGSLLTLEILPGQLYNNNIVILTLDKNIVNEEGYSLSEDFVSFFSTPYTPLYSSYRRILLDLGQALTNVEEETVMLAILEASTQADDLTFNTIVNPDYYYYARRQYVTCLAELMLVRGLLSGGAGDRLSKKLADLSITRDGQYLSSLVETLLDCVKEWEIVIQTGGQVSPNSSLPPGIAVKGSTAEDRITVGRLWESTAGSFKAPAANTKVYRTLRRQNRSFRTRN